MYIFSDYLKGKNTLHHLRISWDKYYFDINFNVTSLNMSGSHYGDTEAILLSTFLYRNIHLQKLDVSHNDISDDGAIAISESLKSNRNSTSPIIK